MDDKTKNISITIPEGIIKEIKILADKDQRSISGYIAKILKDHIQGGK